MEGNDLKHKLMGTLGAVGTDATYNGFWREATWPTTPTIPIVISDIPDELAQTRKVRICSIGDWVCKKIPEGHFPTRSHPGTESRLFLEEDCVFRAGEGCGGLD